MAELMPQRTALELIDKLVMDVADDRVRLPYQQTCEGNPFEVEDVDVVERIQARASILALTLCNPVALMFGEMIEAEMGKV